MTMLHFGTFALFIPSAWTAWTIGAREYRRTANGTVGWRPSGTDEAWRLSDVRPVDLTVPATRRKAVA